MTHYEVCGLLVREEVWETGFWFCSQLCPGLLNLACLLHFPYLSDRDFVASIVNTNTNFVFLKCFKNFKLLFSLLWLKKKKCPLAFLFKACYQKRLGGFKVPTPLKNIGICLWTLCTPERSPSWNDVLENCFKARFAIPKMTGTKFHPVTLQWLKLSFSFNLYHIYLILRGFFPI